MALLHSFRFVFAATCLVASASAATAQTAPAATQAPDVAAQRGQAEATVNAPVQLLGVPVRVSAPDPISYTGSAYQDDISGQSESNSDPAIAASLQSGSPEEANTP